MAGKVMSVPSRAARTFNKMASYHDLATECALSDLLQATIKR